MADLIKQYRERVRKRLGRHEPQPVLELAEALCYPSFHSETLLRVTRGAGGSTMRLVTLTENFWYSRTAEPERLQEVVSVPTDPAARFWQAIHELAPPTIRVENALGCDGMTIEATYALGDASAVFEAWCPSRESPAGRYLNLIYDLAWSVLRERPSIERLEQLHGYLRSDLPARLFTGDVTTLRLFGCLTVDHDEELRQLFDSIPDATPLVMDLTNLEGMGTVLYPAFIHFASRQPITAWAVTGRARKQVEEMGLDDPQLFETTEAASMWLRETLHRPH